MQGWPAIGPCLERLRAEALALGVEVLVADGSDTPPPPPERLWPGVRWLRYPGAGVFALRACARTVARGRVVAVTEDHCLVAPDWCRRLLEAHARHPGAVAVKGTVRNGSRARLVDRAAFLLNQAPHLAPFTGGPWDTVLGVSCVAYKREPLARLVPDPGAPVELADAGAWPSRGQTLVADEGIWVEHCQSAPLLPMSALQLHNGRAVAGLRRSRMRGRDWLRLAALPGLPLVRTGRLVALCRRKGVPWRELLPCLPLFLWYFAWKGAGEAAGYLAGPGQSARRLQ
jgi:hypothetical protein